MNVYTCKISLKRKDMGGNLYETKGSIYLSIIDWITFGERREEKANVRWGSVTNKYICACA